ncbi:MAG TPA: hypothetical protein VGV61_00960 [Thermoanaerobaculia bacterium]|nr:hypothetical protein [Thermoanaerobaculia bacterium]
MAVGPRKDSAAVFAVIESVLLPYVGRTMASTAAAAHCRRLGIEGARFDGSQIGQLLGKLSMGLVILLGEAKTRSVVSSIQSAIDALEDAP